MGLLLPMWRTMIPDVMGQESTRKRIVFYSGAVSSHPNHIPQNNGGAIRLTPSFAPLAPYANEMMHIRGLRAPFNEDLHGPDWLFTAMQGKSSPGGITLDRYIAREIGRSYPVLSLQLALIPCAASVASVSADGKGQIFPAETNPINAYKNTFGSVMVGGGTGVPDPLLQKQLSERRSILDFITDDVKRTQAQLASPERAKLDQYLSSIRDMERELSNLVDSQGNKPSAVCSDVEQPNNPGITSSTNRSDFIDAQVSVAVNALICGMTSVVVLQKNCSATYPGGVGNHTMWHDRVDSKMQTYFQFHTQKIANIRERLGSISEAGGTIADKSLIVYSERCGTTHHNGQNDMFLTTLGSAGGYFRTGTYHDFRNSGRHVSDGFVSIANAMGVKTNSFGEGSKGSLPGLTA
ncbi:MAG: DUF1552 domain-containing protein [Marinagarivorans sp.]|nr:DUF1552 domain-containing protein [Marinagarivorans sp.]